LASSSLYAPTINTSLPAFIATGKSYCRVYFSLSEFSSSSAPIKSVHISVVKQSNGQSVIRKTDNAADGRYRSAGILIINSAPKLVDSAENYYYVDVLDEDIASGDSIGWQPGWIYKIQLRLAQVEYTGSPGQAAWLVAQASNFSEWSTYCTVKATGIPQIQVPLFQFDSDIDDSSSNVEDKITLSISTLTFTGTYSNAEDVSETLYSYNLKLYDDSDNVLEDSGDLFTNQYYTPNQMSYLFKYMLKDGTEYKIKLTYTTINKYSKSYSFNIVIQQTSQTATTISAITLETVDKVSNPSFVEYFKNTTWLEEEEDEGRIGIKFYMNSALPYNGNICLRRASSKDNYTTWYDIKIIPCTNVIVNNLSMIYDNSIESGVWYKYAVQTIDINGIRSLMNPEDKSLITPIIRDFHYSYLIGEGGKQLCLRYNNTMGSYAYSFSETKTDTIGGQYPYITRNGNMKYRTFPINGLISFNMDENKLFITDKEIYCDEDTGAIYSDVISSYSDYRKENQLGVYDFKREFDFREKVLEFLQDGKPKLFKSPSEGNIIVRLMSIAAQPNQTVNRMLASFTSTAYEIADATMTNYIKYGFVDPGDYATDFTQVTQKIGQLQIDLAPGENIIQRIWEKYDRSTRDTCGNRITLEQVSGLTLTFDGTPQQVYTSAGELVLGNNIKYNNTTITVRAGYTNTYVFDENIIFSGSYDDGSFAGDVLTVEKGITDIYDENGNINNVIPVSIDFIYGITQEPYRDKVIGKNSTKKVIGQLLNSYKPGESVYNELYYKYYCEWNYQFQRLADLKNVVIEANPRAVFKIIDSANTSLENIHDMNDTGILDFTGLGTISGITYLGMRKADGSIDESTSCDILIDYLAYVSSGTYSAGG
jgi:hypothetical protein